MIVKKLIEKIEGEAELDFTFDDGVISDVGINFSFYRGIEDILIGKDFRDALIITPRVCGICNHAHLIASVRAIEDAYKNGGIEINLSNKAKDIREFTLSCELIQNHIKWLYLTMLPHLEKYLDKTSQENYPLKASYVSSTINKALAIFGGQWPHSSYAVVGGVTCDPTYVEVLQAQGLIDETIAFFTKELTSLSLNEYLKLEDISLIQGDFGKLISLLNDIGDIGIGYDRFISFEDGVYENNKLYKVNIYDVLEKPQEKTLAKEVKYRDKFYEVGSLARGIITKDRLVKKIHKEHKDSIFSRVFARINEIAKLLDKTKKILNRLDLNEPSCVTQNIIRLGDFEGVGVVEAARGSLIHKINFSKGIITNYEIITPTQWNLSHGTKEEQGIAIKAMIGSKSIEEATLIFRSFDVCSVCTTQ